MNKQLLNSGVECIKLSGHLNSLNADELQQSLEEVLSSSQCSTLVADMADVESLDSTGLMVLVAVLNKAHEHGKAFALSNIPQPIQIILELTQFDQVVEVVDDIVAQPQEAPLAAVAA
jgi:anti-anti-sigma factor